jgi:hypothetical protein
MLERHPSIASISDIPSGSWAVRNDPSAPWSR